MLEHYQIHMRKLADVILRFKKKHLSTTQNDFLHEFIDKAIVSFCNRFRACVAAIGGH